MALNKSSIYDYDERIIRTYTLIEKELSKDVQLIRRHDESMITLLGQTTTSQASSSCVEP